MCAKLLVRVIANVALLVLLLFAATGWQASAQVWDTSGNKLLNGKFYFREVFYILQDGYGDLSQAIALYGTVTFDGNGNYTMNASGYDGSAPPQTLPPSNGTYSISASGYGFISNPLSTNDNVYGLVSQQGIFVGSSTESGFNDLFVAAPFSSQTALNTFKGSYWIADMDLSGFSPIYSISSMFQVNPDGAGNLGNIAVTGYAGQGGSTPYTQNISRVAYTLSNSAFSLSIPTTSSGLISGQKFLYISPDGDFVFGGSPQGFDFFVGVRTGTGTPAFGGLYYQAGIDEPVDGNGIGYLDTFYGSVNGNGGSFVGHQRLADALSASSYDFTYGGTYSVKSDGTYSDSTARYVVGAGGTVRIGSGIGPYLGLSVAVAAPSLTGSGVFLNPEGVVNAGSWAPFTAGIAPGEFIVLVGTGLAPDGLPVASAPFPTTLGPVQVMINGVAAPIYYATPNLIEAIVPYETTGSIAQIQVINNGATSNTVTTFISLTTPGVFTQNQNGLGYGSVLHADYSLVTPSNPAQLGETLQVYLTGLGAVSPAVADGAAAPSGSLSSTTNTITASIGGQAATVSYAGLAPGYVSLYQVNVQVPSAATSGDNLLAIAGPDSYSVEATIPVGTASGATAAPPPVTPRFSKPRAAHRRNVR